LRAGPAILDGQLDGKPDVRHETGQQESPDHPEQRSQAVEECAVGVDAPFIRQEYLKISGQVSQNIGHQDDSREGDDPFFADGRDVAATPGTTHRKRMVRWGSEDCAFSGTMMSKKKGPATSGVKLQDVEQTGVVNLMKERCPIS
jgi:hypothetical protein